MKDFIGRLQKDLNNLQKTLKTEGDDLVKKLRTMTDKKKLTATGKQIEKMVEQRLKKFQPQVDRVLKDIRNNAKKAGINVDSLEKTVRSKLGVKTKKKTATKSKRKAPARKRPAKSASTTAPSSSN